MEFEFRPFEGDLQNENLINEFKGNLFEFQVAQIIAREHRLEQDFVDGLAPSFLSQLKSYQTYLLKQRPLLLRQLERNSYLVLEELKKNQLPKEIEQVQLVGKLLSSKQTEADIIIQSLSGQVNLSLKYTKKNAWLNTKSGGIKSFYKYLKSSSLKEKQSRLSQITEIEFEKFIRKLHENHEINYSGDLSQWRELGLTELPGRLTGIDREDLFHYYSANCDQIYADFKELFESDSNAFRDSLWALLGFQDSRVVQVICFTDCDEASIKVFNKSDLDGNDLICLKRTDSSSSFEVISKSFRLQIRVKPMNRFTVAGLKINCSARHLI